MKTLMELPNDVILEILSWAPAKSLLRFQLVCKHWFDLIRDPKFIKLHLLHHSTTSTAATHEEHHRIIDNTSFFMPTRSQVVYSLRCRDILNHSSSPKTVNIDCLSFLPISNCYNEFKILGSCSGLIYFHHSPRGWYFLWNPSTRELKALPEPNNLCVQPFPICTLDGFGYDHIIDDYKVVRITYYRSLLDGVKVSKVISVYTLGSNSWSTIVNNNDEYGKCNILDRSGLYVNGALHWMKKSPLPMGLVTVTSFDIAKEESRDIQLPNSVSNSLRFGDAFRLPYLSVFDGCLCTFHMNDYDKGLVDVWMMKVYSVNESWTKIFTINMKPLRRDFVRLPWYYWNPLMYRSKDGGILMVFGRKHVVVYDPKKNKTRFDHKIGDCNYSGGCLVASYIGSLVSLNSGKYLNAAGSITVITAQTRKESRRRIELNEENTRMKKQKSCSSSTSLNTSSR